jgi:hypothetical protein
MSKHRGAKRGLTDPWFNGHKYTVRLHCGQWLRIYVGGMADSVIEQEEAEIPVSGRHRAM